MKYLFLVVALFLVSCSGKESQETKQSIVGSQFLNQELSFQETYPKFIAMLQLKEPALLEKLIEVDGKMIIDKDLLERINKEQEQLIEKLNGISSEIQVLYTYKRVMNGLTIVAPIEVAGDIERISGVLSYESDQRFDRPKLVKGNKFGRFAEKIKTKNSVAYINATNVHKNVTVIENVINKDGETVSVEVPVDGKGITVGIIDTGIDYTHKMLGGNGSVEDYKAIDPFKATDFFPNEKVVGGIDLVGKEFSTSSIYFKEYIPKPDVNPIDYGGHGSHVAGTVAGIGDNVNTYSGVAPEASLYALKVFGDESGSTSDSVVLAAFEYAVDPNNDFDLSDSLDVLNLSLGSGYGTPHQFYNYAITNLVEFGTVIVASAGNSGDVKYITGSPGSSNDALSVAAGIDDMEHNWKSDSVVFSSKALDEDIKVRAFEPSFSVKINDANTEGKKISGKLVYAGDAKEDFPEELNKKLKGNVALIDRGVVSFSDKFKRAQKAGAIAVVIANNREGEPIIMGGGDPEFKFKIVGGMITKVTGDQLKALMKKEDVIANFTTSETFEFPWVIGTVTGFSSKGPRSLDSHLKPEITAPGQQVISAAAGTGDKAERLGGTSMSAPHIAGVMALMKQKHKNLPARDLKSMVMSSAVNMYFDKKGKEESEYSVYPLSRQGTGMVDTLGAINSKLAFHPVSLSLGEHAIVKKKTMTKTFEVKNVTDELVNVVPVYEGNSKLIASGLPKNISIAPMSSEEVKVKFTIIADEKEKFELNGFINFMSGDVKISRVPVLAVINQASSISVSSFDFNSVLDKDKPKASLLLMNNSQFAGDVYPFNLLSLDERKPEHTITKLSTCDLQAVGFRYQAKEVKSQIEVDGKQVEATNLVDTLQLGIKLFNPLTDWHQCVVSVEFDTDLDGEVDYLMLSGRLDRMPVSSSGTTYASLLIDNKKREELIAKNMKDNIENPSAAGINLDLTEAVVSSLEAKPFHHSTLNIVEVDTELLTVNPKTAVRVSISNVYGGDVEETDTLIGGTDSWYYMNLKSKKVSYENLPNSIEVAKDGAALTKISITESAKRNPLVLFMPNNKFNFSRTLTDDQMVLVKP